ncbi:MAG: prolipoprotein diacylglyceryl transferase family protein [Acidimicrobiia bacterium]
MEFTLLGAAALGVGAMWAAVRLLDRDGSLSDVAPRPFDALLGAAIAGLVVGRLWAMVAQGTNPLTNLPDVILVRAGVDTVGASLAALATLTWTYRHHLPQALDAVTVPAIVGLAGWHAGCLVRGTCGGTTTDLPWAVIGPGGVGRQPVEVYAALGLAVVAAVLWRWWRRGAAPGAVASAGVFGAAFVRLATEPLRLHLGGGLAVPYAVAAGLGLVGALVAELRQRSVAPQAEPDQDRHQLADGEEQPDRDDGDHRRDP